MAATTSWIRVGWRNIGRNPRRTALTSGGLAVGYFAVVFMTGWTGGINEELIENATSLVGGQIEIHDGEYLPDRSLYDTIGGRGGVDVDALLAAVDSDPGVAASAPRVFAGGLVSSGESTSAVVLLGVDVARETRVSRFLNRLKDGRTPIQGASEFVLGAETARQLAVETGDEVVLVAPGADGSLANGLYTLAGVFETGLTELDNGLAVMPITDLQEFIVLPENRIHEIAVAALKPAEADAAATRLEAMLVEFATGIDAAPWTELHPAVVDYVGLSESVHWIILAIVFTIAVFGVANTMLLATFERRREFAVMLALGAPPLAIAGAVVTEALAIGVVSLAAGALFTYPLMIWWHIAPPDLSWLYGSTTLAGVLITPSLRIAYDVSTWFSATAVLLLTTVLAALYPALRVAMISPADTLSGL
ncbi:MAG: ABC transporter permease [Paracoccaceae bacterium]|nr:ABC transporter permease [Paracoccaceae bacterium]